VRKKMTKKIKPPTFAELNPDLKIIPWCDHQRRTCLLVRADEMTVEYIPLEIEEGLKVEKMPIGTFRLRFQPMTAYPAEKACKLYLAYSQNIGASEEVLKFLGQIINVSPKEYTMATKKKPLSKPPVKKSPTKKKPSAKPKAADKTTKKQGPSAAQMFQDLIMACDFTDDQIFAKVKAKFDLDDKKRGYVSWYRNYLKKQGKKPPEAK
jgi:hypothetical protein